MTLASPLHELQGYIVVSRGPGGVLGLGGYSSDIETLDGHSGEAVTNMRRARDIARRYHGWDVPSEDELRHQAMGGLLA